MSEDVKHEKDIKRFSFSRLKTFQNCSKKHHYQYVEQIETEETESTIPGKLFHKAIELYLNGEDPTPPLTEFDTLCRQGKLQLDPGLLSDVFQSYINYYKNDLFKEKTLMVEGNIEEKLEDEDYLTMVVDHVFEENNLIVIRDHKTTLKPLKYTWDDVTNNQQLLLYVPYVEEKLGVKVNAVEIDEIRIARLEAVPINLNGKPTVDKKKLELVTKEAYLAKLSELGLDDAPEYKYIIEFFEKRGHPLFQRIRVQLLDGKSVRANLEDMWNTYKTIKAQPGPSRNRSILCNYCPFKDICNLDMANPSQSDRKIIIDNLKSK
jgi:CRISPR/Cas system-associated exonuclease Cas4 (RecB family)